jgi:methionine synthase II (cobalamin-independent)
MDTSSQEKETVYSEIRDILSEECSILKKFRVDIISSMKKILRLKINQIEDLSTWNIKYLNIHQSNRRDMKFSKVLNLSILDDELNLSILYDYEDVNNVLSFNERDILLDRYSMLNNKKHYICTEILMEIRSRLLSTLLERQPIDIPHISALNKNN